MDVDHFGKGPLTTDDGMRALINLATEARGEEMDVDQLVHLIVGDLIIETNIFPNQVEVAKQLIKKRLASSGFTFSEHQYDEDGFCEACGQLQQCHPAQINTKL